MTKKFPTLQVATAKDSEAAWLIIRRGQIASMKVRPSEAFRLADALVDAVEKLEVQEG
ncbi:hypothetical protein MHY20_00085 [Helcobacillus sp. ACRRO]|uniref:hypothetical protein n=1 Tax=Helcobacillus sp. ACRRO TaxID=2918202 RepID=UPI001EF50911|nr:hypothetical protein [Helcobacillus sp. ACRRO]MCG7426029.1 hypothetical protein [Helcobacillus sp. ACRRO]